MREFDPIALSHDVVRALRVLEAVGPLLLMYTTGGSKSSNRS